MGEEAGEELGVVGEGRGIKAYYVKKMFSIKGKKKKKQKVTKLAVQGQ